MNPLQIKVKGLAAELTDLSKAHDENPTEESTKLIVAKTAELDKALEALNAQGLTVSAADRVRKALGTTDEVDPTDPPKAPSVVKSIGEQFVENDMFKAFLAGDVQKATMMLKAPVTTAPAVSGASSAPDHLNAGGLIQVNRLGIVDQRPNVLYTLLDLIETMPTSSPLIEYTRWADDRAGADAAEVAEGALKPKTAGFQYELVNDRTRTIAVLLDVTKQTLEDIPQMTAMINSKLIAKLRSRTSNQIWAGNGIGENLLGLALTPGIQTYSPPPGEPGAVSVLKAISKVEHGASATEDEDYYPTSAILMHPDMLLSGAFQLAQDSTGRYIYLDPRQSVQNFPLWGVPVVTTKKIPLTKIVVGDWRQMVGYEQSGIKIDVSESNKDNFERNIVTVRAEFRFGLGCWAPAAFCAIN
jgi:HK97 family phage major capsid protein